MNELCVLYEVRLATKTWDLEVQCGRFESVWAWRVGAHGISHHVAIVPLALRETSNTDKGSQPIIPRVGNVLLPGFQFDIIQLSVAD